MIESEAKPASGHTRAVSRLAALAAGLVLLALPAAVAAQDQGGSVSYTAAQARQGASVYQQSCAGCHGGRLEGMLENPPLAGDQFQSHWFGKPVSELFDFMSTNMPLTAPGSLEPKQYAAVLAYILKQNDVEAGDQELPTKSADMAQMNLPAPSSN